MGSIVRESDGSFTITVLTTFIRPALKLSIFGDRHYFDGYVVNMEKLPNKGLSNPDRLTRHSLDFLYWNGLQVGYGYLICRELPVRVLTSLHILRDSGCIVGYDIDDRGIISYSEDLPNV